jgi:hypothetical protein
MAMRLSTGARNAALDAGLGAAFDGGTGRINFYTGTQPASANNAASGTLLATVTLPSDVFAAAASGAAETNSITSVTADVGGTVGYARFYRTGDTAPGSAASATDRRVDMSVGVGQDITFKDENENDKYEWVEGATVAITGITWTQPSGE